jgi:hypothetical protein
MNFDKNILYWSLPLILWLLQYGTNEGFQTLGKGINHNETLVSDHRK